MLPANALMIGILAASLACLPLDLAKAETRVQHEAAARIGASMAFSSLGDAEDVSHSFSMHGDMVDSGVSMPQAARGDSDMIFDGGDTAKDRVPVIASTPVVVPDDPALRTSAPSPETEALTPNVSSQAANPGPSQPEIGGRAPELPDPSVHDVRQQLWQEWAEKFQLLQDENSALRDKLRLAQSDGLQDIRVDSVAVIEQQALKSRIADLEKEVEQLRAKKTAVKPVPLSSLLPDVTMSGGSSALARTHAN